MNNNRNRNNLKEIIRRIVKASKPDKIIQFGSSVRRKPRFNGDIDLLVIKSGVSRRGKLAEKIYTNLYGVGEAVDLIVATPKDVKKYKNSFCLVIEPALREGKVIYEREAKKT
jgi:predicted nucleotidyltransferase